MALMALKPSTIPGTSPHRRRGKTATAHAIKIGDAHSVIPISRDY